MRVAHLSDMHLRYHLPGAPPNPERKSRDMPELLSRAMDLLRAESPDLLVISGDLVDYPRDGMDDPERLAQCEQDLALTADILAGCDCPLLAIPGNHDHTELAMRRFDPATDQVISGQRVLCFPEDHEDEAHVPHRQGVSLALLEAALADLGSPPQVHVQHYLVWPELNEGYPHTYAQAQALVEEITSSGLVNLVLSGHYHLGIEPLKVGRDHLRRRARVLRGAPPGMDL